MPITDYPHELVLGVPVRLHPEYPPTDAHGVTRQDAAAICRSITDWMLARRGGAPLVDQPVVYPPAFHASGWTIAMEGDYDWTLYASAPGAAPNVLAEQLGLFLEPVTGWALGVYLRG